MPRRDEVHVQEGRAGPSGINVRGYPVRSLRIHGALAPVECQCLWFLSVAANSDEKIDEVADLLQVVWQDRW